MSCSDESSGSEFRSLIFIPREPQWKERKSTRPFVWGQISIRYGRNISSQIIMFILSPPLLFIQIFFSRGHSHQNSLILFLSPFSFWSKTTVNCLGRRFHVPCPPPPISLESRPWSNRHDATIMGVSRYFPFEMQTVQSCYAMNKFQSIAIAHK